MKGSLREYERKREFTATPEPRPSGPRPQLVASAKAERHFCVQEHHASHLHYDFRMEMGGVLKSWAVPKGPTLDPEVRRLAIATEDHPLEYLKFEGQIPEGQYGAGSVTLWDLGRYEPVGDTPPLKQWEQGHIKFRLFGKKLKGEFTLVHMPARPSAEENGRVTPQQQWLLMKKHDAAQAFGDTAARHPGSVLGIAGSRGATAREPAQTRRQSPRQPGDPPGARAQADASPAGKAAPARRSRAAAPRRDPRPALPRPMLATLAAKPFRDPAWVFEIKWDGVRAMARCAGGKVQLISRSGRDITAEYPELGAFPGVPDAVLDGEIVALDAGGVSSFHRLQGRMNLGDAAAIARARRTTPVHFYAFDLLALRGRDLTGLALLERKQRLARLPWRGPWRYSDHVVGDGPGLWKLARERKLEGIVAKRANSTYQGGRSRDWLKFKLQQGQETVIVGYTDPRGTRTSFGALLLAVYEPESQRFVYVGKTGTGFDTTTRAAILGRLRARASSAAAGVDEPHPHWVEPELVAEVKFAEWTPAGKMRAPVFLGLRDDKAPRECVREKPHA